jgi:competence protein ComEC
VKAPASACIAIAYGAGLATGLARFPALVCVVMLAIPFTLRRGAPWLLLAALSVGLGLMAGRIARGRDAGSCAARLPAGIVTLTLRAREPVDSGGSRSDAGVVGVACGGALSVRWPRTLVALAGAELDVVGRWRPRPGRFDRPGGILVVSEVRGQRLAIGPAEHLRNALHQTALRLYGRRAPLVDALVLGRRGDLDPLMLDEFAGSGLVHLLSISGFHLGLLAGWVYALLRLVGIGRGRASLAAAGFAIGYTIFLGWPAPAARAAALTLLVAVQQVRQRMPQGTALLGTTALAVLLVDPWAVLDLGGWLSVAALWGAMNFSAWSDRRLARGAVVRMLSGSTGATIATAPFTAAALGTVALAGIGLNLVAIPLAALVVPAVVASLATGLVVPAVAAPLAAGGGVGLGILQELARWGAAIPGGHLVVPATLASAVPWALLLVAALWTTRRTTRLEAVRRAGWLATAAVWAWLLVAVAPGLGVRPDEGAGLALHFLDVGQGDAAAIRTPGGHWVLVDAGPASPGSDAGRSVVVPFLRRHGVERLDALILSHAHADHLGGAASVLERIPAGEVIDPAMQSPDPLYAGFLAQLDELDEPWVRARRGDGFLIDGVRFRILHPDTAWAEWGADLNENSLVLLVEYRDFSAVLAGDAGLPAESHLAGRVGRADLLKVGHHGSRGATGNSWLGELRPVAAVISVGEGNRYGHPSPDALARLAAAGVDVYRTDRDGSIEVHTDGTRMTIRSRRGVATRTVSDP